MLTLTMADRQALARGADQAVTDALDGTTAGWRSSAPTNEPDAVAAITSVGLPSAAQAWSSTLKPLGYRLQIVGVFCHGSPQVVFNDIGGQPRRCELADLLIVVDEVHGGAPIDRRAVLVQAKIAGHPTKRLSGTDLPQLDLYQAWPTFNFHACAYAPSSRNFRSMHAPGVCDEGRDYGAIDLMPQQVGWEQIDATNPLVMGSGLSLGAALAEMVIGRYGRMAYPGGSDDWSATVDELLSVTYAAVAGGYAGTPSRGVGTLTFLQVATDWNAFGGMLAGKDPPSSIGGAGGEEGGPLSVVHIKIAGEAPPSASSA